MESDTSPFDQPDLEPWLRRRWRGPKLWITLVMLVVFGVLYWIYSQRVVKASFSGEEIQAAVDFFAISSTWMVKEKVDNEDFKGVIVVPRISFRVRNRGQRDLGPLFLLGVFSFMDTGKTMGEGYGMFLQNPLPPGGESDPITLTSAFGYRATSAEAFERNRTDWRRAYVEIFARSRSSKLKFIKSFYISQKIEGVNIDVRIGR
ncbi:MAG: hypothetical protein RB296_01385 [Acidobacteriota bacterium]|jgi:hypothetical protein|nr:hypothetical protein [Acidobacteriota bacterium]